MEQAKLGAHQDQVHTPARGILRGGRMLSIRIILSLVALHTIGPRVRPRPERLIKILTIWWESRRMHLVVE
jgi:hypothetical protein